MRALTLTQPWASAIAVGIKAVETRSWRTSYRGPIAIHAATSFPGWARMFAEAELGAGRGLPNPLPIGGIIATAELVRIERTEDVAPVLSKTELRYGDYSPGRWAWFLENVEALAEPVPVRGALGLWEWANAPEVKP